MTPTDPASGPPSGRAARAQAGGPATHLPPRVAGGTTSPQGRRRTAAAAAGKPDPGTGAVHLDRVTAPVRGRTKTPAREGRRRAAGTSLAGSQAYLDAYYAGRMSEADLEENIRDACKKFGIIRFHVRFSLGTTPGLPDDILIGPSGILWRECKNQKNKPTPDQVKTGEALTALGQDFAIWRPSDWLSGQIQAELLAISRMPVVRVSRQPPVTFAPPETLDGAS